MVAAASAPLWFRDLAWPPMWTDEHFSVRYSASLDGTRQDPNNPPLYWVVLHGWRRATGDDSLESLRRLSAVCSLASAAAWVPASRRVGEATGRPELALGTWSLLVAGPHALLFGRFARPLPLASTMVAVGLASLDSHRRGGGTARLAMGAAIGGLLGTTQYFAAGTYALVDLLTTATTRPRALPSHAAALGVGLVGARAVLGAVGQPSVVDDAIHAQPLRLDRVPSSGALGVAYPVASTLVGETIPARAWPVLAPAVLAWGSALAASIWAVRRRSDGGGGTEALGVAGVLAATFGLAQAAGVQNHRAQTPKMLMPFLGLFTTAGGAGLAAMARRSPRLGTLAGLSAACGAALGTRQLLRKGDTLYPSYSLPWDDAAVAVHGASEPGDAVVTADGPLLHYLGDGTRLAVLATPDLGGDVESQDRALADGRYSRVVVVRRETDAIENRDRLDAVEAALDHYELERTVPVGRHDAGLNRLRRLLARRDPGERSIELRVYRRRSGVERR